MMATPMALPCFLSCCATRSIWSASSTRKYLQGLVVRVGV